MSLVILKINGDESKDEVRRLWYSNGCLKKWISYYTILNISSIFYRKTCCPPFFCQQSDDVLFCLNKKVRLCICHFYFYNSWRQISLFLLTKTGNSVSLIFWETITSCHFVQLVCLNFSTFCSFCPNDYVCNNKYKIIRSI